MQFSSKHLFVEFCEHIQVDGAPPLLNAFTNFQGRLGLPSFVEVASESLVETRTNADVSKVFVRNFSGV